MRTIARRISGAQRGTTIIEVLVVATMLTTVVGAVLSLLDGTARLAPREGERALAIQESEESVDRLVRELRQAYRVELATPSQLRFLVTLEKPGGKQQSRVEYDCTQTAERAPEGTALRRCERIEAAVSATFPPSSGGRTTAIDRLIGDPPAVFSYSPSAIAPTFVSISLSVPSSGERKDAGIGVSHPVRLENGVALRNVPGA